MDRGGRAITVDVVSGAMVVTVTFLYFLMGKRRTATVMEDGNGGKTEVPSWQLTG